MTARTAEVAGAEVAYSDFGSGPLAVYAHGLTASRSVDAALGWLDWTPVLQAGWRLVAYDARGHGASSGAPVPEDYTWSALAGDLLALLDVLAPSGPVSALGSSMGTGTVLHAVLRAPERFDRLVLGAPPTAWQTRAAQAGTYLGAADLVEQQGAEAFAALVASAPRPAVFADLATFPPVPDVAPALLPSVLRGAAASDLPDPQALRTIVQPCLVLAWDGDPGHPVSSAEQLCALLPDAQLVVARSPAKLRTWGARAASFLSPSA
ncbi:MAG: hypothetical protein JWM64_1006 [Frankiales bacterium]|nr:hypothetical protein [Frankiales bacterium]